MWSNVSFTPINKENIAEGIEEMDQQDINNEDDDHFHKDTPEFENSFDNSGGLGNNS
jgi:hypothetical protein